MLKEAGSLAHAGYDVVVHAANAGGNLNLQEDQRLAARNGFRYEPITSALRGSIFARISAVWSRLLSRMGRELFRLFGIESHWQLGPSVAGLARAASAETADYHIVHLEQAAWVGVKLIEAGQPVGIDFEDWFSEDLTPHARRERPLRLLRELERSLLRGGAHATCPSRAMSDALAKAYGCFPPAVVYNAFRWSDRGALDGVLKDRKNCRVPSIHWVSQSIGPGRGLEDLFGALPLVEHPAEVHLRGTPVAGCEAWLDALVPEDWRDRVIVHRLVSNEELLSRIAEHDIGFAGEMRYCRNKELTVSNKMFHYLLGGLVVVASDTDGQREVAEMAQGAVLLYPSGDAAALAMQLNTLLGSPEMLASAKAAALLAAEGTFCWEHQEGVLLEAVRRAVVASIG